MFILYISNFVFDISLSNSVANKSASFCGSIFFKAYYLEYRFVLSGRTSALSLLSGITTEEVMPATIE